MQLPQPCREAAQGPGPRRQNLSPSLYRTRLGLGRWVASDLESSPPRQARARKQGLIPVYPCCPCPPGLFWLLWTPSNHTSKAGWGLCAWRSPRWGHSPPAGPEKFSHTPQGPALRCSEHLGSGYALCLGTAVLLPGLSFPIYTRTGWVS